MKKNVAIFTNFTNLNPGYSLTGIVLDQCRMLLEYGHKVFLIVNENFNENDTPVELYGLFLVNFSVEKKSKKIRLTDYKSFFDLSEEHKQQGEEAGRVYNQLINENNIEVVFTHDFIFTGWNLPYSLAIKKCCELSLKQKVKWFHWVHSVPSRTKDWWSLHKYGEDHFVVFPNKTEVERVSKHFSTSHKGVKVIPHIKDVRTWFDFSDEAFQFTKDFPAIMNAEVCQVYPCSTDRLFAKRLDVVIKMFGYIKAATGLSVCLVAANQWATGRQRKDDVNKYIEIAKQHDLIPQVEFIFTSEYKKEYEKGINRRMLRELMLLSNLFIFPTREESFGLVGPEAALSGTLIIGNKSLHMMREVLGDVPSFDFGSFYNKVNSIDDPNYLMEISYSILNLLLGDEAIQAKVYAKKKFNMDYLYKQTYLPFCLS
jgi:hypothetical protein